MAGMISKIKKLKFPNISRFFTEDSLKYPPVKLYLIFILIILTLLIITGFFMCGIALRQKQLTENYNKKIEKKISYWQRIVKKYNNYPTSYFELAVLEYRLKNFDKSRTFLKKALYLDPGFKEGLKLQELLSSRIN